MSNEKDKKKDIATIYMHNDQIWANIISSLRQLEDLLHTMESTKSFDDYSQIHRLTVIMFLNAALAEIKTQKALVLYEEESEISKIRDDKLKSNWQDISDLTCSLEDQLLPPIKDRQTPLSSIEQFKSLLVAILRTVLAEAYCRLAMRDELPII